MSFFESSGHNLLATETFAGVGHHVALSVVGTDRLLESEYFREDDPGKPDQRIFDPLFNRTLHAVLRVCGRDSPIGDRREVGPITKRAYATDCVGRRSGCLGRRRR